MKVRSRQVWRAEQRAFLKTKRRNLRNRQRPIEILNRSYIGPIRRNRRIRNDGKDFF